MAVRERGAGMKELPSYTDGRFALYRKWTDEIHDFPMEYLINQNMIIWYSEISVFDRVKYEMQQAGIEVTMKIRIPRYKKIDSKCVCIIDGIQHEVYNAAHIINKNGFPETELTLIRPERQIEVLDNDKSRAECHFT